MPEKSIINVSDKHDNTKSNDNSKIQGCTLYLRIVAKSSKSEPCPYQASFNGKQPLLHKASGKGNELNHKVLKSKIPATLWSTEENKSHV